MSRPVIIVQRRHYFWQHVLQSEIVRLRAEMGVADADQQVPPHTPDDLQLCETHWPQEVCTCGAFTLEWERRRPLQHLTVGGIGVRCIDNEP